MKITESITTRLLKLEAVCSVPAALPSYERGGKYEYSASGIEEIAYENGEYLAAVRDTLDYITYSTVSPFHSVNLGQSCSLSALKQNEIR